MSDKLNTLEGLRLASLKAKGYTAEQIAALADTLQGIIDDINTSLEACEAHVSSHANAEENVIVSIKKNGSAIPPVNKIVDISVPTKVSELSNDSKFTTEDDVSEAIAAKKYLKAIVVDTLPSAADADTDAIYYVRQNNSEAGNQYKEYQFINGAAELIGSNSVDLSSYATKVYVEKADNAIVNGVFSNLTASADKYIGAANLALFWSLVKPLITANTSTLEDLKSRVELLELVVHNEEITGNPFSVTFATLDGVNVSGVWNESNNRIDF